MDITTTPHDALFKRFLTDPTAAQDFMEIHLPVHIRKHCDLSTLHCENACHVLEYVLNIKKEEYFEKFIGTFKEVFDEDKEAVMTLEEYFTNKGVLRGIEQGKHSEAIEIAKKMANEGLKVDFIKKVTGLDDQDLQALLQNH